MIFILIVAERRAMMYGARLQQLDFEILIFGLHYKHQTKFFGHFIINFETVFEWL